MVQSETILLPNSPGDAPTVQVSEDYLPLEIGVRYLLFLKASESYADSPFPDLYHGTAEPYRFRLEQGVGRAESPSRIARDLFPEIKEELLLQQVNAALTK